MKRLCFFIPLILFFSGCDFFSKKESVPQVKTMVSKVIKIDNEEALDKYLQYKTPVIVKFETSFCSACKDMAPIYQKLASKYFKRINFLSIEADKLPDLADKYQILGVPTFLFIKDNQKMDQLVGVVSEKEFEDKIKNLL
ncbi:hypothetical protein GF385_03705 [Candidatus Dependentiae bacterium]|nr:hypothetical protein [Candidatus Dependentiae bacterium]